MTKFTYRAFNLTPASNPELSLLQSSDPTIPPPLTFYMDDFFGSFRDFEDQFAFLRDHFFPHVEWATLLLLFHKLRLFARILKALGLSHEVKNQSLCRRTLDSSTVHTNQMPHPSQKQVSMSRALPGMISITQSDQCLCVATIAQAGIDPASRWSYPSPIFKWWIVLQRFLTTSQ